MKSQNRMRVLPSIQALLVTLLLCCTFTAHAENWPQWRGPFFNGSTTESKLPQRFSKTENVRWVVSLPGPAAATPAIWDNQVFVSSVDDSKKVLLALCFDRLTGKLLWQHEIAPGINKDDRSNFASGSPTTDGKLVYFYYGSGDLVAFDFEGKQAWARNIQKEYGPYAFMWTFSSSPTLFDNKLFLQILQRNEPVNGRGRPGGPNDSYLLALDPKDGHELWKSLRPSDARQESFEAYSTPIPFTYQGRTELLITGGDCITGHDPASGKEFWRWATWNPSKISHWRMVVSPSAGDGIVLACAPKGAPVYAFKAGAKGKLNEQETAWVSEDRQISSDVSTPLFYKGKFFILNSDRKVISAVEPASGKILWSGSLNSRAKLEASPTGADDRVFLFNHRGDVFIVGTGDKFDLQETIQMGEDNDSSDRSTIAIAQGNIFIRTGSKLYCIGNN